MVRAVEGTASAKVNLYLHVVGRRADGYHLLDSLIAFAAIHDRLRAEPADELSLAVTGPFADDLAEDGDNLVLRAARALADLAGRKPGGRLVLEKNLPVASGIGGGSADAAAALRLVAALWNLAPDEDELARLGLALGADVPICLAGRAAFVGGIGEEIELAPLLPEAPMVLVNPGIAVATPAVFGQRDGAFSEPHRFAAAPDSVEALAVLLAGRANDLYAPAVALAPEIADCVAALASYPDCLLARMSGSGATCFGLFASEDAAAAAAAGIAAAHPRWWVAPTWLRSSTGGVETT